MLAAIAEIDAFTFTDALASGEPTGAFAAMAIPILPDETASASCEASSSTSSAGSEISNPMLVKLERLESDVATMLLTWFADGIMGQESTKVCANATCESASLLNSAASISSSARALAIIVASVGARLGSRLGALLGCTLDILLGFTLGVLLGSLLGDVLGSPLGALLGSLLGKSLGSALGALLGLALGTLLGA